MNNIYIRSNELFTHILSFFPRVESRGSALLAINTGMLALLSANAPAFYAFTEWYMYIPLVPVILIAISIWHLYKSAFPQLDGGNTSMIYFREIATRTESRYIEEFNKMSEQDYHKDLLGQIWRNSVILKEKYHHLKLAFVFLAWSFVPWIASLMIFVRENQLMDSLLK